MFGTVDRAMATAGAAEIDHKTVEAPFEVVLDGGADKTFGMVEETGRFLVVLEPFGHSQVAAGHFTVLLESAGVGQRTTVEDKASAVAGLVVGDASFVGEAEDADYQHVGVVLIFGQVDNTLQHLGQVRQSHWQRMATEQVS